MLVMEEKLHNSIWIFFRIKITEFADKWKQISEFEDLLLPTDKRACKDIDSVVKILEPYANLGDKERGNLLNTSQQTLRNCIKIISVTTTYYGGTFFYTQTLSPSNNYGWGSYVFQGFIYNPNVSPTPPTPTRKKKKFPWVLYARKIRNRNVNNM